MSKKEVTKFIDLIIKDIADFDCFDIDKVVRENLDSKEKNKKEYFSKLIDNIVLFGNNNDLFVSKNKHGWFSLTEKGKRLKQSNKTFKKFQKSENKSDWYNKPWVGYLIAAIVLIFTVYQHFDNRSLNREVDLLIPILI